MDALLRAACHRGRPYGLTSSHAAIENLFEERGEPAFVRSDNCPEFVGEAARRRLEASGIEVL
jgi:hypothetical protein